MSETVKVIVWDTEDSGEGGCVYRLDDALDPNAGNRFFTDLLSNAETDGREAFKVVDMPYEEWLQCCKIGDEMA